MKFSLEWIRQFVDPGMPPAEVARRLTSAGLQVETVTPTEGEDHILDIEIVSNRPDCMNIYGLAREVAAACGRPLAPFAPAAQEDRGAAPASSLAKVAIDAPDLCGRYAARVITGVRIAPSPDWMVRRLASVGVRPVNNIVDATNFVLWEYGHPLHAFDLDTLHERRIVVRRARPAEAMTTLDGVVRKLSEGMLVIADASRPVALAGIMGGESTMVSGRTTNLLLESAHFNPGSVRRTARALGLATDASYRFERGADPEAAIPALDRVAELIHQSGGGVIHPGVIEARPAPPAVHSVRVRIGRVATLLGMEVPASRARQALAAYGIDASQTGDDLTARIPSHRGDLAREVDLVEEVARHIGYDAVPERLPHIEGTGAVRRAGHRRESALRQSLSAAGFAEAITTSFATAPIDAAFRRDATGAGATAAVVLANPVAADQEILRTTLLPGLLAAMAHNLNRGMRDARLYEIGRVFTRKQDGSVDERLHLAMAMAGAARPRHWLESPRDATIHDLTGIIQGLLAMAGVAAAFPAIAPCEAMDPACAATINAGETALGHLGALAPAFARRIEVKDPVLLAEIDLTTLFTLPVIGVAFRPLARYPAVSRDLSLIVREGQTYSEIEAAIRETAPDRVAQVSVFDRYAGEGLPAGSVGLSINVVYQHTERTLSSEEVAEIQSRAVASLGERLGARLRT